MHFTGKSKILSNCIAQKDLRTDCCTLHPKMASGFLNIYLLEYNKCVNKGPSAWPTNLINRCLMLKSQWKIDLIDCALKENLIFQPIYTNHNLSDAPTNGGKREKEALRTLWESSGSTTNIYPHPLNDRWMVHAAFTRQSFIQ